MIVGRPAPAATGRSAAPSATRFLSVYALAVVLLTALVLGALEERGPRARWIAVGVALGLALFGLCRYWEYLVPRLALAGSS